jgi:hypothetical protein
MWTVRTVTSGVIGVATSPAAVLFPRRPPDRLPNTQPWRIQLSDGSDAEGAASAGGWCWQSHQLPPGQSSCLRFRHAAQIMFSIVRSDPGGGGTPAV